MAIFTPPEAPIHEPKQLPVAPPPKIIGRDRELGQIFAQVRVGAPVLVYGAPGIGKSALAATIAAAFTTFPAGVLWWQVVDDSLEQLVVRLGRAYGKQEITESANPLALVDGAAALLQQHGRPLLVLDGPLPQEAARDFVRRLAAGVPLIWTAEQGASGPWLPFRVDRLGNADAMALLSHAARRERVEGCEQLCRALEGVPLAVVLAGRHLAVSQQTPGELLGALDPAAPDPALKVLSAIYRQLPEALRGIVLTIGATPAGRASSWLLERLQPAPGETFSSVLESLAIRGLVYRLPAPAGLCYAMHESVARFARGILQGAGHLETVQAHVEAALLTHAAANRRDDPEARMRLLAEMPNLLALADEVWQRGDEDILARLADVLEIAFGSTGAYGFEVSRLYERLGQLQPEVEPGPEPVAPSPATVLTAEEPEPEPMETTAPSEPIVTEEPASAFYDAGAWEPSAEQETVAPEPVEEAEAITAAPSSMPEAILGTEEETAVAEHVSAPLEEAVRGEIAGSVPLEGLLQACDAARRAGNDRELLGLLMSVGQSWEDAGLAERAIDAYREALSLAERLDDEELVLQSLEALARLNLETGNLEDALTSAVRAENLLQQRNEPGRLGYVLALLGDIRLEVGDLNEAADAYARAIGRLRAAGDQVSLGVVQTKLGATYMDRGEYGRAVNMLNEALLIFEQTGRQEYQERVLGILGMAYGHLGEWRQAEQRHLQALQMARDLGNVEEQERQLANLGYIAQAREDRDAMVRYYASALDLAYQTGRSDWQVRYLDVLGRLLMDDVSYVALAVALLQEAQTLDGDPERDRWLSRAQKRLQRLRQSAIPQAPVPMSLASWAAAESILADGSV